MTKEEAVAMVRRSVRSCLETGGMPAELSRRMIDEVREAFGDVPPALITEAQLAEMVAEGLPLGAAAK